LPVQPEQARAQLAQVRGLAQAQALALAQALLTIPAQELGRQGLALEVESLYLQTPAATRQQL
jgi:hypothetical protein